MQECKNFSSRVWKLARNFLLIFCIPLVLQGCPWDRKKEESLRPDTFRSFLEVNGYNLVYPAEEKIEPGEIRAWDKNEGLSHNVVAFKDQCFGNLQPRPNTVDFLKRTVKQSGGVKFLVGLHPGLIPYEAEIKAQFEKDYEVEIDGGKMDTLVVSEIDLINCLSELPSSSPCIDKLRDPNNVIIAQVVKCPKLTFKFRGLKRGGMSFILAKLANVGFESYSKDEEALELNPVSPMVIAFTGYQYEKHGTFGRVAFVKLPFERIEIDDISKSIAEP